jgi:hypothetical protein
METEKQRSLKQNRYRFSVVVKYYQDWLNLAIIKYNEENGTNLPMLTAKDANFYIKDKVWNKVERIEMPFGEVTIELPIKGSSTKRFEEYMEEARWFAAEVLHFELPLPLEDIRDLEVQYADNLSR